MGDDAFGRLLVDTLARAGIETRGIRVDPTVFTTLAFVTLVDGERSFSFARKPGADTLLRFDELELSLIDQSRAFHFGALSLTDEPARSATRQAVAYARTQGKLVTFDPNYRPPLWRSEAQARAETLWGLEQADVVKGSVTRVAPSCWGCYAGAAEGARRLAGRSVVVAAGVCISTGAPGLLPGKRQGACRVPAPAVRPVDTTGAGDIFGGQRRGEAAGPGHTSGGAGARRAGGHRPLRRHRRQPVHPPPRRHLLHPHRGGGAGRSGRVIEGPPEYRRAFYYSSGCRKTFPEGGPRK